MTSRTIARHPALCGSCEGFIQVGDPIVKDPLDGARVSWIHERCPVGRMDITRPVCTVCFTEKSVSGECMCEDDR